MDGDRKIKKFGEFMSNRRFKGLNQIVIVGKTKKSFFYPSKDFELQIFYTPGKKVILQIISNEIDIHDKVLNVDFKIGDSIEVVKNWVERKGHEIISEIERSK
jgi:hypothetical protein